MTNPEMQVQVRLPIGVALLVFTLGAVSGVAGGRVFAATGVSATAAPQQSREGQPPGEGEADEGIPEVVRQLNLPAERLTRVREIVARFRPRADSISELVLPRVRALEVAMRREIACVLTPDERARWRRQSRPEEREGGEGSLSAAIPSDSECAAAGRAR